MGSCKSKYIVQKLALFRDCWGLAHMAWEGGLGLRPATLDPLDVHALWRSPCSIVLTRLLRATPQTKLFFLAYFVLLHLLIVVTIFT